VIAIKKIIILILIPLLSLVTVQICLKNPQTRELFTDIENKENINFANNNSNNIAKITVTVTDGSARDCYILYNGRQLKEITGKNTVVSVNCNGVMEIKNNSGMPFYATAVCYDNNADIVINNSFFTRGINTLCFINL
jgi:hypothetical protein